MDQSSRSSSAHQELQGSSGAKRQTGTACAPFSSGPTKTSCVLAVVHQNAGAPFCPLLLPVVYGSAASLRRRQSSAGCLRRQEYHELHAEVQGQELQDEQAEVQGQELQDEQPPPWQSPPWPPRSTLPRTTRSPRSPRSPRSQQELRLGSARERAVAHEDEPV